MMAVMHAIERGCQVAAVLVLVFLQYIALSKFDFLWAHAMLSALVFYIF